MFAKTTFLSLLVLIAAMVTSTTLLRMAAAAQPVCNPSQTWSNCQGDVHGPWQSEQSQCWSYYVCAAHECSQGPYDYTELGELLWGCISGSGDVASALVFVGIDPVDFYRVVYAQFDGNKPWGDPRHYSTEPYADNPLPPQAPQGPGNSQRAVPSY